MKKYYFDTILKDISFEDAIDLVTEGLEKEGFGIITEIDVKATFKKKIDVDFRPYMILGACNPEFAHNALTKEDKVGVFLPCNVIVQQLDNKDIEVAAVDPFASMMAVENDDLGCMALKVENSLKRLIRQLQPMSKK